MADSALLRLPRELRDTILTYVVETGNDRPLNPSFPGRRTFRDHIAYPERAQWSYVRLRAVSRQLRQEYHELIEVLLATGQLNAELDIMSKGYLMYPTWTYLPPCGDTSHPVDLNVTLRIFSTEAYRSNDGWPRQVSL